MLVKLGQVVTSRAGSDQGKRFLVMSKKNEKWIFIVDGSLYKIEKPKKKNISHLIIHPKLAEGISKKLMEKEPVTNQEVRKALFYLGIAE